MKHLVSALLASSLVLAAGAAVANDKIPANANEYYSYVDNQNDRVGHVVHHEKSDGGAFGRMGQGANPYFPEGPGNPR
ncbi:hypothetical protein [Beijerinckia mobilis]|uniref:hypothetical protein n=1 Tax=Beijerinckia mobilis TaxID=231434 RepID=UPI000555272D|nr:hypothetical protein [Beijerinckia mobilis]